MAESSGKSFVECLGDGATTTFSVPFPYLSPDHVKVEVDSVDTAFTFLTSNSIQVTPAPADQSNVRIKRVTPDDPLVDFSVGNQFSRTKLLTGYTQILYVAQEAFDEGTTIQVDAGAAFDDIITQINTNTATLQAAIDAYEAQFTSDINDAESTFSAQIAGLQAFPADLQGTLDGLAAVYSALDVDLTALQADLVTAEADIDALEAFTLPTPTVVQGGASIDTPENQSPADGQDLDDEVIAVLTVDAPTLDPGQVHVSTTFQVSETSDFAVLVHEETLAAPTLTSNFEGDPNVTYYWRARFAITSDGEFGVVTNYINGELAIVDWTQYVAIVPEELNNIEPSPDRTSTIVQASPDGKTALMTVGAPVNTGRVYAYRFNDDGSYKERSTFSSPGFSGFAITSIEWLTNTLVVVAHTVDSDTSRIQAYYVPPDTGALVRIMNTDFNETSTGSLDTGSNIWLARVSDTAFLWKGQATHDVYLMNLVGDYTTTAAITLEDTFDCSSDASGLENGGVVDIDSNGKCVLIGNTSTAGANVNVRVLQCTSTTITAHPVESVAIGVNDRHPVASGFTYHALESTLDGQSILVLPYVSTSTDDIWSIRSTTPTGGFVYGGTYGDIYSSNFGGGVSHIPERNEFIIFDSINGSFAGGDGGEITVIPGGANLPATMPAGVQTTAANAFIPGAETRHASGPKSAAVVGPLRNSILYGLQGYNSNTPIESAAMLFRFNS